MTIAGEHRSRCRILQSAKRTVRKQMARAAKSEVDLHGQATRLRALVAGKNDCYVVNPITGTNLIAPLRSVKRPIVNIDSPVDPAERRESIGHNDRCHDPAATAFRREHARPAERD